MRKKNDVRPATNGLRPGLSFPALALFPIKRAALALALTLGASGSWAGYAQAVPSGTYDAAAKTFVQAANDSVMYGRISTSAVVNVGGKAVTMPASMRFASNASKIGAIALFANPVVSGLLAAAAVGTASYDLYQWLKTKNQDGENVLFQDGSWYGSKTVPTLVQNLCYNANCGTTAYEAYSKTNPAYPFKVELVSKETGGETYNLFFYYWGAWQPRGPIPFLYKQVTGSSEQLRNITTPDDFSRVIGDRPIPDELPKVLPKTIPWPVEAPVINPSPLPSPVPYPLPNPTPVQTPQPYRVPLGDPVPIPNTSPVQYTSPAVDVVPSPTVAEPWRVDVQPKDVITNSPSPLVMQTADPALPGTPKPASANTQTDCDKYPDIIGCSNYGDKQDPDKLAKSDIPFQVITEVFSSSNGCPSDLSFNVIGRSYAISYRPLCDRLGLLRTLFICMAGVMAAYILADSFKIQ